MRGDPAFDGICYGYKFTQMVRALCKKDMKGDLQNEDKPKVIEAQITIKTEEMLSRGNSFTKLSRWFSNHFKISKTLL
jgi:hypothetical protein